MCAAEYNRSKAEDDGVECVNKSKKGGKFEDRGLNNEKQNELLYVFREFIFKINLIRCRLRYGD